MTFVRKARLSLVLCFALLFSVAAVLATTSPASSQGEGEVDEAVARALFFQRMEADMQAGNAAVNPALRQPMSAVPCENGMAGTYPCENIDLHAFLPIADIGGGSGMNDIWGWTDPQTGKEYALAGRTSGTSFVDVTDPENPIYLGNLPTHTTNTSWRDIKVYNDHAFIVSEASGHGMQVFDLTQLRNVANPPVTFSNTAHYDDVSAVHNLVINEDTGFAYTVGNRLGGTTCAGGLHMVDIQDPTNPTFAGCFSSDGYTHDAQCVVYSGPDADYQGDELCFAANEDTLTIVNVTDKSNPVMIARIGYAGSAYTHQGWLNDEQTYFFMDDELDEQSNGHNTRSYVWDIDDLDSPQLVDTYDGPTPSIDHNMYYLDGKLYQSNYTAGVYILDATDPLNLTQLGFFDVYPSNNSANFNGTWSNYPYFESGTIVATSINTGLFVLEYNAGAPGPTPTATGPATSIQLSSLETDGSGDTPWFLISLAGVVGLAGLAWVGARRRS